MAHGMLAISNLMSTSHLPQEEDSLRLEVSSPLLGAVVLMRARQATIDTPAVPAEAVFDPLWIAQQVIRNLPLEIIQRPEAANAAGRPTEYVLQALVYGTARGILTGSYLHTKPSYRRGSKTVLSHPCT